MDNLILDKKTGVFRAGNMDFGCGALSGRLVFSESGNTSLATVYADGMPIGTAALSSDAEASAAESLPSSYAMVCCSSSTALSRLSCRLSRIWAKESAAVGSCADTATW